MPAVARVAIAGGGIGGLTLASALSRRGVAVRVLERAPRLDALGAGIWMPPNAMEVLEALGVAEAVAARGVVLRRVDAGPATGAPLLTMDVGPRSGWRAISLHRARLQEALASAVPAAAIELGAEVARVEQSPRDATLVTTDGRRVEAELVVGADGVRSEVRRAVVPEAVLRDTGQTCWRGVARLALADPSYARELWASGRRFGYSALGPNEVYWFAPVDRDLARPLDDLPALYADFPEPVSSILAATPPGVAFETPLFDLAPLPTWHRGRLVLLGDAAHAMTPNLGQGGAQAIEDALALAAALDRHATVDAALADYERRRRRRVLGIVRQARLFGRMSHWRPAWLRAGRDIVLRSVPRVVQQRQLADLFRPRL